MKKPACYEEILRTKDGTQVRKVISNVYNDWLYQMYVNVHDGKMFRHNPQDIMAEKKWLIYEREQNSKRKDHSKLDDERSQRLAEQTQINDSTVPVKTGSNWLPWASYIEQCLNKKTSKNPDGKVV